MVRRRSSQMVSGDERAAALLRKREIAPTALQPPLPRLRMRTARLLVPALPLSAGQRAVVVM